MDSDRTSLLQNTLIFMEKSISKSNIKFFDNKWFSIKDFSLVDFADNFVNYSVEKTSRADIPTTAGESNPLLFGLEFN